MRQWILLIVLTILLSTTGLSLSAGGIASWVADRTGIQALKEVDKANKAIKDAVPPYKALDEGATKIVKEATVETAGPALAEWIRASRNDAVSAGVSPIPFFVRKNLSGFFTDDILDSVSFRVGRGHELSLQNNSFEFGDRDAITLEDVVVFKNYNDAQNNLHLWAHELGHVVQYRRWGLHDFAKKYVRGYQSVENDAENTANGWENWARDQRNANSYTSTYSQYSLNNNLLTGTGTVTCFANTSTGQQAYWVNNNVTMAAQGLMQWCSMNRIGCTITHCQ